MVSLWEYKNAFLIFFMNLSKTKKKLKTPRKVTYGCVVSIFISNIFDCECSTFRGSEFEWTLVGDWGLFSNLFHCTGSFTIDSMWCFIAVFESSWVNFRFWTNNAGSLISEMVCSNECDDCKESDGLQIAHMNEKNDMIKLIFVHFESMDWNRNTHNKFHFDFDFCGMFTRAQTVF